MDMTRLIDSGNQLMIVYEDWVMAVALVLALVFLALAGLSIATGAQKRLWTYVVSAVGFGGAAYYFLTYTIILTHETGWVYAFLWHDEKIAWAKAASAQYVEPPLLARRSAPKLVIVDRDGAQFVLPLNGIYGADRQKVLAFVQQRLPVRVVAGR